MIPRIPIGNLSVSPHGVGIAIGYFLGATLMARRARRTGFNEDHAWNAAVVGVLGAIVGARVAYIVGHPEQFRSAVEYLQIYKGGISLMGGLIGGFLAAFLYCRAKKLDFLRLADLGAPGLAIGTAIGRIGDLVIGDHLGTPTDGFWGWEYQGGELISSPPCDPAVYPSPNGCIQPGMVVHQTALYDSLWSLVIFFILMRLDRKPRPKGFLVLTWAALYSIGRILTDLVRVDKTWFGTGLTGSQLTAIVVLVLSLFFLARLRKGRPAVAPATAAVGTTSAEEPAEPAEEPATEAGAAEEPVSPVPPVDPEAPEAAAIPVEPPPVPEEEAEAAAADAPVSTPLPPSDDVPPVETPPTPPVEAMVVDSQAPPVVDIPPVEQAPATAAGETITGAAAVEEIPPPAEELAATPNNETAAEATEDGTEPPVGQPATEVLPAEPAAGSTTASETETADPTAGDTQDELPKGSQEP
ncbi:MAG TPA: prolipoprotein diacylglyceryl transferase family protein [Actinomycetota bacterium]|nr:prolipoprotein diacylglyceryl transferase family protein [Actinomycetota bacterium]